MGLALLVIRDGATSIIIEQREKNPVFPTPWERGLVGVIWVIKPN